MHEVDAERDVEILDNILRERLKKEAKERLRSWKGKMDNDDDKVSQWIKCTKEEMEGVRKTMQVRQCIHSRGWRQRRTNSRSYGAPRSYRRHTRWTST